MPLPRQLRDFLTAAIAEADVNNDEDLESYSQKALSLKIDLQNQHLYKTQVDNAGVARERARVRSINLPRAGDWLNVVPIPALGLHMGSQDFVACLQYRLGLNIYQDQPDCTACGMQMDNQGDHSMNCRSGSQRNRRHNAVRDVVHALAAEAGVAPQLEVLGLVRGSARPADVLLPGWDSMGRAVAVDVTVVNPVQIKYIQRAAHESGIALEGAKQHKKDNVEEGLESVGITFLPFVMESFGGWDQEAVQLVKRLANQKARNQGREEEGADKFSYQRVSIALMRGNAQMLTARKTDTSPSEMDDYI